MIKRVILAAATTALLLSACSSSHQVGAASSSTTTAPASSTATSPSSSTAASGGSSTSSSSPAPSVIATPVQTIQTTDGVVAYRSLGSGAPLILIMGFAGSIDSWQPDFVDALAAHFRVITPNNAGVGRTTALPNPLTITAMSSQMSALITALHLGSADILGWSMGGMIAQALAVTHPTQVTKLVLCATLPGDGHATDPSAAAVAKLTDTSDPSALLSLLFPADQPAAESAYVQGILSYPDTYTASKAAVTAQEPALAEWTSGSEAAGRDIASIKAPTLVADGAEDPLGPLPNDQHLASTIPGAQLEIYPDSAHAFLFQNEATFIPKLLSFLG